jgi:hypothetical protein
MVFISCSFNFRTVLRLALPRGEVASGKFRPNLLASVRKIGNGKEKTTRGEILARVDSQLLHLWVVEFGQLPCGSRFGMTGT